MLDVTRAPTLTVPHGFLGRTGGVSTGHHGSLNCGLGSPDQPETVRENRARALAAVAPGRTLVAPYQTHSAICLTVTDPWPDDARPEADALVTATPGIALSILTADCAPILFADPDARVIGAAHAGWKGALAGVTDATIDAMEALGARRDNIAAAIGPCIAQASYEVSASFRDHFVFPPFREGRRSVAKPGWAESDPDSAHPGASHHPSLKGGEIHFAPGRLGHLQFDLEAYVAHRLAAAGLTSIHRHGEDTLAQPDRYFSYRRSTLAGEPGYGRQISIIALD